MSMRQTEIAHHESLEESADRDRFSPCVIRFTQTPPFPTSRSWDPRAGAAPVQTFSRRHSLSLQTAHRSAGPWNLSIHQLPLPVSLLSPWLRKEGIRAEDRLRFPKSLTAVQSCIQLCKRTELKDTAACPGCFWQFKWWNTITAEKKKLHDQSSSACSFGSSYGHAVIPHPVKSRSSVLCCRCTKGWCLVRHVISQSLVWQTMDS